MDDQILNNIRVLLVDDDEDDYLIIRKIFEQVTNSPFVLSWTSSFEDAKKLIKQEKHDAYLIDYRLGEHTGLDLLRYAKPEKRLQPFILLTGASDQVIEWSSMMLAASDYLVKGSFDASLLTRTLFYAIQRKRFEAQRLDHLIELNRSKDEFISIASHQLRTPATAVKQYIGLVLDGFAGEIPDAQRQLLDRAYESNERQLRIVSDLLKVAQLDAGKVALKQRAVKVNALLNDILRSQKDVFDSRRQEVVTNLLPKEQTVHADQDRLRMVFENIIDNASKYSEENMTITVDAEDIGDAVAVRVKDEGVGIDPANRSRLFEKFSRIENSLSTKVGGTGLGLYWAKKIIDLHDGLIQHEDNKPQGTIFTIVLKK
jgi:signal transduction histidine kinase